MGIATTLFLTAVAILYGAFTLGSTTLLAVVLLTALNRLLKPGRENNLSKPQSE